MTIEFRKFYLAKRNIKNKKKTGPTKILKIIIPI